MSDHLTIDHKLKREQRRQDIPSSAILQAKNLLENADDAAMVPKKGRKPRILLVISAQPAATMRDEIAAGRQPPRDYDAIQQILDNDVIHPGDAQTTRLARLIKRAFGPFAALAWTAFCHRHMYDIIFTDTEIVSLPFAMLLKLSAARPGRPRHVALAHYLSPFKKRIFFRLGVGSHINTLIVHCAAQRVLATETLHIPGEHVVKLPYFVDVHFWQPLAPEVTADNAVTTNGVRQRPMIFAAGGEFRDYPTLLKAVEGLDVDVHIAAASAASFQSPRFRAQASLPNLPSNVSVGRYDFAGMRRLYSKSRFVVVPVCQTNAPFGITVILEAMAMGKAVIVSGTRGQTDVIRDPRNDGRGPIIREWWPGFVEDPRVAETLGRLPTGFYVTPGDSAEMRSMIQYLLNHPEVAEELGCNGRRVVEEYFSLEAFAQRFAAAILGEQHPAMVATCQTTT